MSELAAVILAAGCGKRMRSGNIPKVLVSCNGQPLINYVLKAVENSKMVDKIVIVVGHSSKSVKEALGPSYCYVEQPRQHGTGHAVKFARSAVMDFNNILVLYGDHPTVKSATVQRMIKKHHSGNAILTMATVTVPDFEGWRQSFYSNGRIIRDDDRRVIGIVELADTTPQQGLILEVNPSYFCFQADWLWQNIGQLRPDNAKEELYLTDMAKIAFSQGELINDFPVDPLQAVGVNTPEELERVRKLLF